MGGVERESERERERSRDGSGADGVEGRIKGRDRALKTFRLIERLPQELISRYVLPTHLPLTTQAPNGSITPPLPSVIPCIKREVQRCAVGRTRSERVVHTVFGMADHSKGVETRCVREGFKTCKTLVLHTRDQLTLCSVYFLQWV